MKNTRFITLLLMVTSLITIGNSLAFANERDSLRSRTREKPIHTSQASPEKVQQPSGEFGVGFSTLGLNGLQNASITGVYLLNSEDMLHGFFSIPQTSPFNIGGALLYKHTLVSSSYAGFHVGGGLGLASLNVGSAYLALNLTLVGGFHFKLPSVPNIAFHFDGGPTFSLANTRPNSQTNFQISAFSPTLGASILYMF